MKLNEIVELEYDCNFGVPNAYYLKGLINKAFQSHQESCKKMIDSFIDSQKEPIKTILLNALDAQKQ